MAFERQDISIIGSNISKFRKLKKYTQKQLGDLLDVNPKTVSKWENGTVGPDITILKSLADALDVSVEELLSGIKNKNKKYKHSILLNFALSFIILLLISCITYMYVNRYEVYEFKSNHEQFNIEGYIVSGRGESRFVFEDFVYVSKNRSVEMIKELKVEFYLDDKLICFDELTFNEKTSLELAIGSIIDKNVVDFEISDKNLLNKNFFAKIIYVDSKDNYKNDIVDLNFNFSKNEN